MDLAYSTGNEIVDQVAEISITGNVVPLAWFQTLTGETGKPMLLAIDLLADIVYWYRPKEIRDEGTGDLLRFEKRFKADLLQRSYRQIENRFGVTKKQARTALDFLCKKGVIIKHLRDELTSEGVMLHNNMYLELVPEKLRELTFPQVTYGVPSREPPSVKRKTTVASKKARGDDLKGVTNTEMTTSTSAKDYDNPINKEPDEMDVMNAYEQIIKENISYDSLVLENNGRDKSAIDEMVGLLAEIVSIKRKTVVINGAKYPYEVVKGQLLKLDCDHVRYVLNCMKENTTKIRNIRNYILTALYNAPNTIDNYYQAEVNHDMYGIE